MTAPYAYGSVPSRQAADLILGGAAALRRRVYALIASSGERGLTDDEIQDALGMSGNTERPRRRELVQRGLVQEKPGVYGTTRSGRKATLWRTAHQGPVQSDLFE